MDVTFIFRNPVKLVIILELDGALSISTHAMFNSHDAFRAGPLLVTLTLPQARAMIQHPSVVLQYQ